MTISAEEIAKWIKRRVDQGQPLISLSPSMACDVVASLTDMKTEIEKRVARIAALEAQLAEAAAHEREECANIELKYQEAREEITALQILLDEVSRANKDRK